MVDYFDTEQGGVFDTHRVARGLFQFVMDERERTGKQGVLVLCVGTDRCLWDSYGPLVGHLLSKYNDIKTLKVYGDLNNPVHATNMGYHKVILEEDYSDYVIVAVDASIGSLMHKYHISIADKPLRPGVGAGKDLGVVGDFTITGVIGTMDDRLSDIRLSLVTRLAECTVGALKVLDNLLTNDKLLCEADDRIAI